MEGERITRALARIEAATGRIQRVAESHPAGKGDPELKRRYEVLRSETGAALAELDRLIEALRP